MSDGDGLYRFTVSSVVPAPPARVWERITSMEGINHELMPIARMTHPRGLTELDPAEVPIGRRLFRSWILLFCVLPIDYDDITLLRFTPASASPSRHRCSASAAGTTSAPSKTQTAPAASPTASPSSRASSSSARCSARSSIKSSSTATAA